MSINNDGKIYNTSITVLEVDLRPKNHSIKTQNFGSLEMWLDNPVSLSEFTKIYNKVLNSLKICAL